MAIIQGDAQTYRGKDEVRGCARSAIASGISAAASTEAALLDAAELDAVDAEVAALIDHAVATARSAAQPPKPSC